MRVISHPILGEEKETEWVTIYVNGKPIQAKKGEMILAALHARTLTGKGQKVDVSLVDTIVSAC